MKRALAVSALITLMGVPSMAQTQQVARILFEKLGLRREGEFLNDNMLHGEWVNTVWYAALAEEYGDAEAKPPA